MLKPTDRVDDKKEEKDKKGQLATELKQNKFSRTVEDGLLLVIPPRINGHCVCALIDSGATRCFVTPACITAVGLKGIPKDIFLELGNGQKYLSRGFVPDVSIVIAGLTMKLASLSLTCFTRWISCWVLIGYS